MKDWRINSIKVVNCPSDIGQLIIINIKFITSLLTSSSYGLEFGVEVGILKFSIPNPCIASSEGVEDGIIIGLEDLDVLILDVGVSFELKVPSKLGVASKNGG